MNFLFPWDKTYLHLCVDVSPRKGYSFRNMPDDGFRASISVCQAGQASPVNTVMSYDMMKMAYVVSFIKNKPLRKERVFQNEGSAWLYMLCENLKDQGFSDEAKFAEWDKTLRLAQNHSDRLDGHNEYGSPYLKVQQLPNGFFLAKTTVLDKARAASDLPYVTDGRETYFYLTKSKNKEGPVYGLMSASNRLQGGESKRLKKEHGWDENENLLAFYEGPEAAFRALTALLEVPYASYDFTGHSRLSFESGKAHVLDLYEEAGSLENMMGFTAQACPVDFSLQKTI